MNGRFHHKNADTTSTLRRRKLKTEQLPVILDLSVSEENSSRKSHAYDYRDWIVTEKNRFKYGRQHEQEKLPFSFVKSVSSKVSVFVTKAKPNVKSTGCLKCVIRIPWIIKMISAQYSRNNGKN